MTYFDEARALRAMIESRGLTQSKLASLLGVSQSYIANKVRLLSLSPSVEAAALRANLSERHARTLLRLPTDEERLSLIERIQLGKMSVAEADIAADLMLEDGMACTPRGINFAERVGHFEKTVHLSLSNLRSAGIKARSRTEKENDKLYITICIG